MSTDIEPINIVIVEDDPRTLSRLVATLAGTPHLRVAAAFGRVVPALSWLATGRVDVLLTDLGLPDGSGIDVIKACVASHPRCDVMVISMFGDERNVLAAIEAGAAGYILKDADELDVVQSILNLRAGGSPMSPLIARRLVTRMRDQRSADVVAAASTTETPELTKRESETLDFIARGYTYQEVGQLMGVSVSTVQTHIKSIYGKLAVNSRCEAVFEARALGLLKQGDARRR